MSELDEIAEASKSVRRWQLRRRPSPRMAITVGACVLLAIAAIWIVATQLWISGHIDAAELATRYRDDEHGADREYTGCELAVRGTVLGVARDAAGNPFAVLSGAPRGVPCVQCFFPRSTALERLIQPGQRVTIHGRCTGRKAIVVTVIDCEI